MLTFAYPIWFLLMLPLLVSGFCLYGRQRKHGLLFAPLQRLSHHSITTRKLLAWLWPAFVLASMVFMTLALARPRSLLSVSTDTADAIAIQMVVDISGSMEALDFSEETPDGMRYRTRLDVVKEAFETFIGRRPYDLIGLITFGGYATTLVPLTSDHDALRHTLSGVEIPKLQYGSDGLSVNPDELMTAIGDALTTACARLERARTASRIIVLLSDGDSNAGIIEPETAMRVARAMDIKVYTIGVGTTGRAPIRVTDPFGRESIRQAWIDFDEAMLQDIADTTGGVYYHVMDMEGLERALAAIDTLETTRIERTLLRDYDERHAAFSMAALVLLVFGISANVLFAGRIV